MSVLETLVQARALYAEAPSHAPMLNVPEPGTHCVMTALNDVRVGEKRWMDVVYASHAESMFHRALEAIHGGAAWSLAYWNAEHTTDEVLAVFDRAIEMQAEREDALEARRVQDSAVLAFA